MSPGHFPPSRNIAIGTMHNTLIEQITQMEAREGQLPDPRLVLALRIEAEQEQAATEQAALPGPLAEDRVYEVNGETRPGILEMVPVLGDR